MAVADLTCPLTFMRFLAATDTFDTAPPMESREAVISHRYSVVSILNLSLIILDDTLVILSELVPFP